MSLLFCDHNDPRVCTAQPTRVKQNCSFLIDATYVSDISDLRANDWVPGSIKGSENHTPLWIISVIVIVDSNRCLTRSRTIFIFSRKTTHSTC